MAHVCPPWLGRLLASPLRKVIEKPQMILSPFVHTGMTVLEPGPGMGFFTLPLAEMVGPRGRVVAVDLSPQMLKGLKKRAAKVGAPEVIETRVCQPESLGLDDLAGKVDFALAINVVHELSDQAGFFEEIGSCLKTGAQFLLVEPKWHVSPGAFAASLEAGQRAGLTLVERRRGLRAVLRK